MLLNKYKWDIVKIDINKSRMSGFYANKMLTWVYNNLYLLIKKFKIFKILNSLIITWFICLKYSIYLYGRRLLWGETTLNEVNSNVSRIKCKNAK